MLPPTLGRSSTAPPPALLSYQDLLLPAAFNISYSSDGKSICLQCRRPGFDPWVGKIPWRRKWQPTPVFLPGKSHGSQSLLGYCPWGHKESDTTERLHFTSLHFSISQNKLDLICHSKVKAFSLANKEERREGEKKGGERDEERK